MTKELRIVLVVPTFPKVSETFIVSKFRGLLDRGMDIHVLCNRRGETNDGVFPELRQIDEVPQRIRSSWPRRPIAFVLLMYPLVLFLTFIRRPVLTCRYLVKGFLKFGLGIGKRFYLDAAFISLNPDIIHFEFGSLAAEKMYLRELLDCKVTVGFRGYDLNFVGIEDPDFYRDVWKRADGLHLLGDDLWKRALNRGCDELAFHTLIPPAIDTAYFRSKETVADRSCDTLNILSVGRLDWRKGYEYALQSVKSVVEDGIKCRFTIVGDGNYLESISFAVHQLGLDNIVYLKGACSREEVREIMQSSDIFLHAAVSEGFCNAVIEAQAMELPVVSTDAGGLPENVIDGTTGFIVPRRDPRALANSIMALAESSELRGRMGEAGRKRVLQEFRIGDQITAFEKFYRNVADKT